MTKPTVELHQAFLFTCEDCGRDSFVRAVTLAPESIDMDDLPEGLDPEAIRDWLVAGGQGDMLMAPDHVRCGHCGAEFGVAIPD